MKLIRRRTGIEPNPLVYEIFGKISSFCADPVPAGSEQSCHGATPSPNMGEPPI